MLKNMRVVVKYEIWVQKNVIAEDNESNGKYGYDTQRERIFREVSRAIEPKIDALKEVVPNGCRFDWEQESSIEED